MSPTVQMMIREDNLIVFFSLLKVSDPRDGEGLKAKRRMKPFQQVWHSYHLESLRKSPFMRKECKLDSSRRIQGEKWKNKKKVETQGEFSDQRKEGHKKVLPNEETGNLADCQVG